MRRVQRIRERDGQLDCLLDGQRAPRQPLPQAFAFEQFHRDERRLAGLA